MNAQTPENEITDPFIAEMKERVLDGESVILEMDLSIALSVLAMLQLALRHPETAGVLAATQARHVACAIEAQLGRTPAIAEVARRGWLAEYDTVIG